MIFGPSWLTFGGAVALAFALGGAGGLVKGHAVGSASAKATCDAKEAKYREAIDNANVNAQAAAELYEEKKAKREVRYVTVTREIQHAIEASPGWGSVALPDGVRDAIATASAAADPAGPEGGLRVSAPEGADQLATGSGLRPSAAGIGGMLGAASSPR